MLGLAPTSGMVFAQSQVAKMVLGIGIPYKYWGDGMAFSPRAYPQYEVLIFTNGYKIQFPFERLYGEDGMKRQLFEKTAIPSDQVPRISFLGSNTSSTQKKRKLHPQNVPSQARKKPSLRSLAARKRNHKFLDDVHCKFLQLMMRESQGGNGVDGTRGGS